MSETFEVGCNEEKYLIAASSFDAVGPDADLYLRFYDDKQLIAVFKKWDYVMNVSKALEWGEKFESLANRE